MDLHYPLALYFVLSHLLIQIHGKDYIPPITNGILVGFISCLNSLNVDISYPTNDTWWYDSQGIHVPFLRHPHAVAYAESTSDVAELIKCAVKYSIPISPRSGGHSYEAFSSLDDRLVIDISRINSVSVDRIQQTATAGAGIRLGGLYYELGRYKMTFPAGSCPTVGLGGQIAAGGFGFLLRKWGLAADNVIELQMVDWRGKVMIANSNENPLLFFALRGGGGGSYGIVTQMVLRIYPNPKLTTAFTIQWKNSMKASEYGKAWFKWKPWASMPEDMTIGVIWGNPNRLSGMYIGEDGNDGVLRILKASGILDIGGGVNYEHYTSTNLLEARAWMDNGKHFGSLQDYQIYNTPAFALKPLDLPSWPTFVYPTWELIQNDCKVNNTPSNSIWTKGPIKSLPPSLTGYDYMKYSSQMFTKEYDSSAYAAMDEYIKFGGEIQWKPHGGVMDQIPTTWNGFPHRHEVHFNAQYFSPFHLPGTYSHSGINGQNELYQKLVIKLEPFTNHMSYEGYLDLFWTTDPKIYMPRYYGPNVTKLIQAKNMYDPHDFFNNPQSTPRYL